MKFDFQKTVFGTRVACVYKIQFDTGHFYIGCSSNFRARMLSWRCFFGGRIKGFPAIVNQMSISQSAEGYILEVVPDDVDPKFIESKHLALCAGNELCLNSCFNSKKEPAKTKRKPYTRSAPISFSKEVIAKRKATMRESILSGDWNSQKRVPIIRYDLNGNFIEKHPSVTHAASIIGSDRTNICKVLSGKRKSNKGFFFKYAL